MTKGSGFPLGARGHDIADLYLAIGDDDTIDEAFDQWSALGKGQRVQRWPETATEGLDAVGERGHIDLLLGLRLQLAPLMRSSLLGAGHRLMLAFERITAHEVGEIDFQKPRLLALQGRQGLLEGAAPRLQGVRKPGSALGALQCVDHQRGLLHNLAEILPDQSVECPGWRIAGGAALPLGSAQRLSATTTQIRVIPRVDGPACTRQLTWSTTHEAAQEGVVGRMVTTSHWGSAVEPDLDGLTGLLADDRGHWDRHPCLRRGEPLALSGPDGPQCRLAVMGGDRT